MDPKGIPTGDEYTMAMLAMMPLGHRPDAKSAAVIGFGSGMSTSLLLSSPNLTNVVTVEIEPSMAQGARNFLPVVAKAFSDPRSHIVIDDAKSYFARGGSKYDIIVSEPSNPWVSGVASLFTEEFYARLNTYLNDGGVLSQWLHTYEMDGATLASILKAIAKTFPDYQIYSSIDADLVIIARKSGAAGKFDPQVIGWPGMRETAARLKLDSGTMERRMVASWRSIGPFFSTYGIAANSDFFPVVDHRASKTRFTRERADMLQDLQLSPVPMLEMFDGAHRGNHDRGEGNRFPIAENARQLGWAIHDLVMGGSSVAFSEGYTNLSVHAYVVNSWATSCRPEVTFQSVLPHLHTVAQHVNPNVTPEAASQMWTWLMNSPCGRKLAPADRKWLELFESIGRRDPVAMAANGRALLETTQEQSAAIETAALAATVGLVCQGQRKEADTLMSTAARKFFRRGERDTELRYLLGITDASFNAQPPDGRCVAPTSGARR